MQFTQLTNRINRVVEFSDVEIDQVHITVYDIALFCIEIVRVGDYTGDQREKVTNLMGAYPEEESYDGDPIPDTSLVYVIGD